MEQLNSSLLPSNISSSPGLPPPASWDSRGLVPSVVLSLCFLLGVPGNIAVIVLKPNWQHLSSLSQTLMLNLAISDLLCLLPLPVWIYTLLYRWTLGLVACRLLTYLLYCSIHSSLLTVTVLSVQRFVQVVKLQKRLDQVGKRRLLVLLWLVAMILSIPSLMFEQLPADQQWTKCVSRYHSQAQEVAVLLTRSLLGFLSMFIVAFSYISLYRKVKQAAFFNNPQMTRLVTSIIVSFFVLLTPYCITNVIYVAALFLKNESLIKMCSIGLSVFKTLTIFNSCLNPLLYAFASRNMCMCRRLLLQEV